MGLLFWLGLVVQQMVAFIYRPIQAQVGLKYSLLGM